tara:strand:- start:2757 stop:3056 length:300 start_codon:yes stop_codon:yes gene_type:complete
MTSTQEERFDMKEADALARLVTKATRVIDRKLAAAEAEKLIEEFTPYARLPHVQELLLPLKELHRTSQLYKPEPMRELDPACIIRVITEVPLTERYRRF